MEVEPLASDRQKLNLVEDQWHFISVTVVNTDLVYFIDGEYVRGATLSSPIQDDGGVVYVGRKDQRKPVHYFNLPSNYSDFINFPPHI